ncbi:MAG TPA: uroporphyrinogen-III C-methyltransferase [Burkholderiales bacterium]
MAASPLKGRGIVVTRPAGQAEPLVGLIEANGGRALRFPAIEIEDLPDWRLPELAGVDLAVFTSPTAVQKAFEKLKEWPQALRAAAVGRGTGRELERRGVKEVLAPDEGADSEALLALAPMQELAGKRIVIFRGEGGRALLGDTLAARGAQVEHADCYRRARPRADAGPLLDAWERGEVHAVTVSSAEALDNLSALLGDAGRPHLALTPLFATHERIAEHAKSLGIQEVLVGGPGDRELLERLMAYFAPRMSETESPRKSKAPLLLLIALLLAVALAGVLWYDARQRIDATQAELARRMRDIENDARDARLVARQSQEAAREALGKLGQLEARVAESQSQQVALEQLYQDLSRNRDEWQLAEVEQVIAIASQQLQLAGNVRAALLALQLAEARLARADRPQFQPIRRALARDIERLQAVPAIDLPAMSTQLDALVAQVDALPLAFDERGERIGAAQAPAAAAAERGFWSRLGAEVWDELRQLVVVRKVDNPEPPLLPPSQAYFLRENLRLRLLSARLTLLSRDEAGYREDLRAAQAWIRRYFDPSSKQTADALAQLQQLSAATLSFEMPSINESLEAVRAFKSRRDRTPQ